MIRLINYLFNFFVYHGGLFNINFINQTLSVVSLSGQVTYLISVASLVDIEEFLEFLVDGFPSRLGRCLSAGWSSGLSIDWCWICVPSVGWHRRVGRWDRLRCWCDRSIWVPCEVELVLYVIDFQSERSSIRAWCCGKQLNLGEVLIDFDVEMTVKFGVVDCGGWPHWSKDTAILKQCWEVFKCLVNISFVRCVFLLNIDLVLFCNSLDSIVEIKLSDLHGELSFDFVFNCLSVDGGLANLSVLLAESSGPIVYIWIGVRRKNALDSARCEG